MGKAFGAALIGADVALLAFFTFASSDPCAAQQTGAARAATPAKAVPRASWDGKPDLTGVWQSAGLNARAYGLAELERLYQPSAKQQMKALTEKDDPIRQCAVYGYPRRIAKSFPIQLVQAAEVVVVLDNRPHVYRYIPTDGRKHTEDVFPTYQGDSVGRWDGDTLVVDVTTFNGKIWLC